MSWSIVGTALFDTSNTVVADAVDVAVDGVIVDVVGAAVVVDVVVAGVVVVAVVFDV